MPIRPKAVVFDSRALLCSAEAIFGCLLAPEGQIARHAWIACEFMIMIQTMNRADKYRFILPLLLFLLLSVMLQCLLIYYRHFQHIH